MLSSFLPSAIPSGLQWEEASKCVQKGAHLQPRWQKSNFIFIRDSVGRLWIIIHPPLFQPLSSPSPTSLGMITKTHRGGFFLLVPTLFPPPRHWRCWWLHAGKQPVQWCVCGIRQFNVTNLFLAQWVQHSFHSHYFNSCDQCCKSNVSQPPQRWLASLRFLLKAPLSAATFLSICSRLAPATSPHTCDCIREKRPK